LPDALTAHAAAAAAASGHGDGHAQHHPALQHHFETLEQQKEASVLGMWIFIIQEVMFFGGLFAAYMVYRIWYPEAWSEGSGELDILLGGINTIVLIGSSLTMALAVRAAQTGGQRATVLWLLGTMALGLTFLVIKFFEYKHKWDLNHIPGQNFEFEGPHAPQVEIFISLYFALTGLHALHMVIGFGILSVIAWMAYKKRFSPEWYTPVEMSGLYWHFVDIVWIFLFPLLYLVDRAHQAG
jgi:cytochrome c oxidase subunit 3